MHKLRRFFHDFQGMAISTSVLGGAILVIFFVLYPFGTSVYGTYKEVQSLEEEVVELTSIASLLSGIDEAEAETQLGELVATLPLDKSLPSVFSTLEGVAAHNGLSIEDISLGNTGTLATEAAKLASSEEKKLGVSMQPIIFSGAGPLSAVDAFLREISSVKRFIRVNYFDASFSESDEVRIKMNLSSFYAPLSSGKVAKLTKLSTKEENILTGVLNMPLASGFVPSGDTVPEDVAIETNPDRVDPFSL